MVQFDIDTFFFRKVDDLQFAVEEATIDETDLRVSSIILILTANTCLKNSASDYLTENTRRINMCETGECPGRMSRNFIVIHQVSQTFVVRPCLSARHC